MRVGKVQGDRNALREGAEPKGLGQLRPGREGCHVGRVGVGSGGTLRPPGCYS